MEKTVAEVFGITSPRCYKGKQNPDKTSNDDLMVGIELEVENIPRGIDFYTTKAGTFWSVVEDGSLRPRGQAWEFVSKPALLGTLIAELRIFFDKFGFNEDNYGDRTSVHLHTNVLDFTQEQVASIALVYPVFEAVLFQYVNHHQKLEDQGYCRDTNLYCIPWSDCRMNRSFVDKFFRSPEILSNGRSRMGPGWQKYTALNMLPIGEHGTVEWRHMHGTADMEKLTTWLNVIGAIMKFCKDTPFNEIVKNILVLNDVSTYQQFFNKVLAGTLPYQEQYRQPMSEGVINAKYSLVNWEANKGKKSPLAGVYAAEPQPLGLLRDWEEDEENADRQEDPQIRPWANPTVAAGIPVPEPGVRGLRPADHGMRWAATNMAAPPADWATEMQTIAEMQMRDREARQMRMAQELAAVAEDQRLAARLNQIQPAQPGPAPAIRPFDVFRREREQRDVRPATPRGAPVRR